MYRLLFDTNAMLDVVMPGRPLHQETLEVLKLCNGAGDLGMTASLSLKDVYYVLERAYDKETAQKAIDYLMDLLVICPVSAEECHMSLQSNEPDFEDGLIRAVAELEGADFIITRDKKAFAKSKVKSVDAKGYLEIVECKW
ncbi:MAG: PIN domain-containing protein [Coriobacteriales bacterium]|nr:PIN domain-containing protein [Coriobacteriales bacterium]